MTSDFSYVPATVVGEASATGEIAELFADICDTMGIPLITSIWRGLAGRGENPYTLWDAARAIYLSGYPGQASHGRGDSQVGAQIG